MYGPRPGRPTPPAPPKFSWTPYIVMGVVLFIILAVAPRIGFWPMLLLLVVGVPIVRKVLANVRERYDERTTARMSGEPAKRKTRPYRAASATATEDVEEEKPKRRPEYTVGDDGELIEIDPDLLEEQARRNQSRHDSVV